MSKEESSIEKKLCAFCGVAWKKISRVNITLSNKKNGEFVQVENTLNISSCMMLINEEGSKFHKYGITTSESNFTHLVLSFKFYSLYPSVSSMVGKTYGAKYTIPMEIDLIVHVTRWESKYVNSNSFTAYYKVFHSGSPFSDHKFGITSAPNYNNIVVSACGVACYR